MQVLLGILFLLWCLLGSVKYFGQGVEQFDQETIPQSLFMIVACGPIVWVVMIVVIVCAILGSIYDVLGAVGR